GTRAERAAHAPGPRPRAHEGVRRERPRADRDDTAARPAEPSAVDDRILPDMQRHRAGVYPGDHRAAHGALRSTDCGRGAEGKPGGEASPRHGDLRAGERTGSPEEAREGAG